MDKAFSRRHPIFMSLQGNLYNPQAFSLPSPPSFHPFANISLTSNLHFFRLCLLRHSRLLPPPAVASFPANISSLILSQSHSGKSNSHKLLALAIAVVVSVILVVGILVFFYFRWSRERTCNVADEKSFRLHNAETNNTSRHKLRTSSTTSSEFLYFGTLVNSRRIEDSRRSNGNVGSNNNNIGSSNLDSRKVDSPELRLLPPADEVEFGVELWERGR